MTKIFNGFLITILLVVSTAYADQQDNNICSQAERIYFNNNQTSSSGKLSTYRDEYDYYTFTPNSEGVIDIQIETEEETRVVLYNTDCSQIITEKQDNGVFYLNNINVQNVAYTIMFQSKNSSWWWWQSYDYSFDVTFEKEPNKPQLNLCFQDSFNQNNMGDVWQIIKNQNFTPIVNDNKMRLTNNNNNVSAGISLSGSFPTQNNYIEIEFDHFAYRDSSGADGISVVLSDASKPPIAGAFGGSLGYAQKDPDQSSCDPNNNECDGFDGGWLGIGIDEYGNFSNPTEGRIRGPGRVQDSVAIRGSGSGQTGYQYLTGTGSLTPGIDANGNNNPDYRYRISIDTRNNTTLIKVERDTKNGQGYSTIINWTDISQNATPPENFILSLTGSTGGSTNYHEIDNLEMNAVACGNAGSKVDHYEIIHDGNGLKCQPENIIIKACADNQTPCTPYSQETTVTLNTENRSRNYTFLGSTNANVAYSLDNNDSNDIIGLSLSQGNYICNDGQNKNSGTACNITFHDSGFVFNMTDEYSCKPQTVNMQALQTDSQNPEKCIPAFQNTNIDINFSFNYNAPTTGGRQPIITYANTNYSLKENDNTTIPNIYFDSNAIAEFDLKYADAGSLKINASFDNKTTQVVGSNLIAFYPYKFEVFTNTPNWQTDNTSDSSVFVKAGENFNITAKAKCWTDKTSGLALTTPNYKADNVNIKHTLIKPAADAVNGKLGVKKLSFSQGEANIDNQTFNEVGIINLTVTDENYFGYSITGTSKNIGRFIPDMFKINIIQQGIIEEQIDSKFTYTGQKTTYLMTPKIQIEAINVNNNTTKNYEGGFAKLTVDDIQLLPQDYDNSTNGTDGNPLQIISQFSKGTLSVINNGIGTYTLNPNDTYKYLRDENAIISPFISDINIHITDITDSDGVSEQSPTPIITPEGAEIRYGVLDIQNNYAPETEALKLPVKIMYWDNNEWQINTDDSETAINNTMFALINWTSKLNEGDTSIQAVETITNGIGNIILSAPGQGKTGDVDVILDPNSSIYNYLQKSDKTPGTATFGIYRGRDRIIEWREVPVY